LDGRTHVQGASKILEKLLRKLARRGQTLDPFKRFLFNTWLYLDVLSSLSSGEDPYYLSMIASHSSAPPTQVSSLTAQHSLQSEIDSLLGCAADLFPLIAKMSRISNRLAGKVVTEADLPMILEAICVRDELLKWQPPQTSILRESRDVHCSLDDIVRTAELYRLSSLLHLYRAFPPLGKNIRKLADQILDGLLSIPGDSASLCIHIWPLMAAGCEHILPDDRRKVMARFEVIRDKLKLANVDTAMELLEKVWERRDGGDMDAGWVTLARECGWNLLLG
jgi:Fungal specific transcription factor domain